MSGTDSALPPGYELVRRLGSGAFGEVVLARQVSIDRLVAVKQILPAALANPDNVDRFRREARVLAATDCPSVVKVYDLRRGEGGGMLVMEYVPGATLAELIEEGPLPAAAAMTVLGDVAEALRVMAEQGIVHRDVKPGNVFVLPDGHAKLGDFGLARITSDDASFRTVGGSPAGTPAYFPPEVSQGIAEPDHRSDAYSFAVMAYETLTGERPFEAPDAMAMVVAHWDRAPRPPEEVLPGIPDAAAAALTAGLSKVPGERPLPHELVARLAAVPEQDWPAVTPRRRTRTPATRSDPTIARPGFVPGTVALAGAPTSVPNRPGSARRRISGRALVTAGVALVAAVGAVAWTMLGGAEGLAVTSVDVEVAPTDRGRCPEAVFEFTGVIRTNGAPGTVVFRWTRPDGESTEPRTVEVRDGQESVTAQLRFTLRGRTPLVGEAVLRLSRPEVTEGRAAVSYVCPGG